LFPALLKLPKWKPKQDLYRAVNVDLVEKYPEKYCPGNEISWYGFTSTTKSFNIVVKFLNKKKSNGIGTIFTINRCLSGRRIDHISSAPTESEVIIPPVSKFKIKSINKLSEKITIIQIKQIISEEDDQLKYLFHLK